VVGTRSACYLDASALVKLVVTERETEALRAYLGGHSRHVTSMVAAVEVPRAVARLELDAADQLAALRERMVFTDLDETILTAAAGVEPASLRTLDAIHLATALYIRSDLAAVVTYDRRLADAAQAAGLPVVAPRLSGP